MLYAAGKGNGLAPLCHLSTEGVGVQASRERVRTEGSEGSEGRPQPCHARAVCCKQRRWPCGPQQPERRPAGERTGGEGREWRPRRLSAECCMQRRWPCSPLQPKYRPAGGGDGEKEVKGGRSHVIRMLHAAGKGDGMAALCNLSTGRQGGREESREQREAAAMPGIPYPLPCPALLDCSWVAQARKAIAFTCNIQHADDLLYIRVHAATSLPSPMPLPCHQPAWRP